jgi:hypothetical protein
MEILVMEISDGHYYLPAIIDPEAIRKEMR